MSIPKSQFEHFNFLESNIVLHLGQCHSITSGVAKLSFVFFLANLSNANKCNITIIKNYILISSGIFHENNRMSYNLLLMVITLP